MLQKMRRHNQKGFTLIELMIVIAIIGILSAIAIPNFLSYRTKGMNSAAESTANNFMSLGMGYISDTGNTTALNPSTPGSVPGFKMGDSVTAGTSTFAGLDGGKVTGDVTFAHVNGTKSYKVEADTQGNPTVTEQ